MLLLLLACAQAPVPEAPPVAGPPDVLLVTIDTLRADRVGCYGDTLANTPRIDALAGSGVLFREAHAVTPLTLPSHASILTGLYPVHHGLRDNAGFRLSDGVPTLAESMSARGYATAAFVSAFVLDGAWGLDHGFDLYRDPFHPEDLSRVQAFGEVELPGAEVVNAAVAWWKDPARGRAPRFAWVHLYDPHTPWQEHPGTKGDPYRGEVAWADSLLGRLLDVVGDDALVVVTSDHGEGLWDHGEREHGVLIGRSVTRVPLVVRPPGGRTGSAAVEARATAPISHRPAGVDEALDLAPVPDAPRAAVVVEVPVSGVDVAPTIADYAGGVLSADGRSLRAEVEGGGSGHEPVYAETFFPLFHFGWSGLSMAQDDRHRVEVGARVEGMDTVTGAPVDASALLSVVERWRGTDLPVPGPVDAPTAEALAALGYLTETVPPPEHAPDPRDKIGVLSDLRAAEMMPHPADAVRSLQALVAREPDMADARIALGLARVAVGDSQGALADHLAVLERWPDHPTALANAAFLARQLGERDLALGLARRMETLNPHDARGFRLDAAVHVDREDAGGVMKAARAGLLAAPADPNLHYLLALAEIQEGDPRVGIEHLEAARAHGTRATDVELWLGVASERAGDIDAAAAHYTRATHELPGDLRPWAMAGWMLYQAGRCDEARPFLINVAKRGARNDPKVREALQDCGPG